MILSKKRITKVLISLGLCAGWSAPLLFAHPEDRFSCVEAHFIVAPVLARVTYDCMFKLNSGSEKYGLFMNSVNCFLLRPFFFKEIHKMLLIYEIFQ